MFKHLEENITENGIKLNDGTLIEFGEAKMDDEKVKTLPVRAFLDFYNLNYICGYLDIYESGYIPKQNKKKLFPSYQLNNRFRISMRANDFDDEDTWKKKLLYNKLWDERHRNPISLKNKVIKDDYWARYDYKKEHGEYPQRNKKLKETTYIRQVSYFVDCKDVYQIDFDTEKDKIDADLYGLLKKLPYTRSTTKLYGRHIFFTDDTFEKPKKRKKVEFLNEFAWCMNEENNKKSGADFLTNWSIVKADEVVFNADKIIQDTIRISKYLKTPTNSKKQHIKNNKEKTEKKGYIVKDISDNLNGVLHIQDDSDEEEDEVKLVEIKGKFYEAKRDKEGNYLKNKDGKYLVKNIYVAETDEDEDTLTNSFDDAPRDDAYYKIVKENIKKLFSNSLKNNDYDTTAGWVMRCASSNDVIVKNILHEVLDELNLPWRERSRPNAPDGHDFIEEKWEAYFSLDKKAQKGYVFTYGEPLFFKPTEIDLARFFLQVYNNTFLYNEKDNSFYVFESEYSANESRVKSIFWTTFPLSFLELCKETYKELPYFIVKQCEDGKHEGFNTLKNTIENQPDWEGTPEEAHQLALVRLYQEFKKKRDDFLEKFTQHKNINNLYQMVKTMLPSKKYNMINRHMDYNEESKYKFHFKNGCYNFKLNKFEDRTDKDYVTKVLDYNYKPKDDDIKEKMKEIGEMIKKIHPNETEREFFYKWNGYCLTGYTNLQKFLYNVGKKAGNGKSTLTDIGCKCFPLYWTKMDSKVFNKDNTTADKTLQRLIDNPYRRVWLEELQAKKDTIDVNKLKDFTAGGSKTIKPMYKKEVCLNDIHAKFEINTNYDPKHANDKGVERRGLKQEYNSMFKRVKEDDYEKHIYKADGNLIGKFDKTIYKLAYFHLFLPYAVECVENKGIIDVPSHLEANFKKLNLNELHKHILTHFKVVNDKEHFITKKKMVKIFWNEKNPWIENYIVDGKLTVDNDLLRKHNFTKTDIKDKFIHLHMKNWIVDTFALINTSCVKDTYRHNGKETKWELYHPKYYKFYGLIYNENGGFEYEEENEFGDEDYSDNEDDIIDEEKEDNINDEEKEENIVISKNNVSYPSSEEEVIDMVDGYNY